MQTIVLVTINVDKYISPKNASKITSKKSKQHNVFEAEEQIWRTELVYMSNHARMGDNLYY